jgi:hypothetical protein
MFFVLLDHGVVEVKIFSTTPLHFRRDGLNEPLLQRAE